MSDSQENRIDQAVRQPLDGNGSGIRATAVVGPDHVGGLRPQFSWRAVDGTVVGAEGDTAWQACVDGPRGDVATRVRLVVDGGRVAYFKSPLIHHRK